MAERYRKDHASPWPNQGVLLFLLPVPLVWVTIAAFAGNDTDRFLSALISLGLLWCGALLNRSGLQAEANFRRRKIATAPRTPRKTLGALFVGLGVFFCTGFVIDRGLVPSLVGGALAALGAWLAYGTDPRRDKVAATASHGYTTEEIVATLQDAEDRIDAIEVAGRKIHNSELGTRLRRITEQARKILGVIEEDPGDIRRARKFLNTYLDGARQVTEGYARMHGDQHTEELEGNFRNVLETIEQVFAEQHEKLLADDALDLDVKIEVLTTQLKREGVI